MLNPSAANEFEENRTSDQCIYFAKKFGYGSIEVTNLFSIFSTDPKGLKDVSDPIGQENDRFILEAALRAKTIVIAWGEKYLNRRNTKVLNLLRSNAFEIFCLKKAKSGHPRHPSRLSHSINELSIF